MVRTLKVALKSNLNHFREATNRRHCEQFEPNLEKLVYAVSCCSVNGSRLLNAVVLHPKFSCDGIQNQSFDPEA